MTPIGVGIRAEGISFDEDAKYAQLGLMYRTGRRLKIKRPKLAAAVAKPPVVAAPAPPPVAKPNLCNSPVGLQEEVTFHNDSAELTSQSTLILNEVANTLTNCESILVDVSAHTDSVGTDTYNQVLSEKRASSVVNYFGTRGLDRNRFTTTAFGESKPIDTNETDHGRARNRRVELYSR